MTDERQPCLVIELKGPLAPVMLVPNDGEYFDGFSWEVTGDWMQVEAFFLAAGASRTQKIVLRANDVERIHGIEKTPEKRSG